MADKVTPISIRLEPEEKVALRQAAESVGMGVSEFARLLLVNATSVVLTSGEDFAEGEDRFSFVWRVMENRRQAAQAENVLKTKAGK